MEEPTLPAWWHMGDAFQLGGSRQLGAHGDAASSLVALVKCSLFVWTFLVDGLERPVMELRAPLVCDLQSDDVFLVLLYGWGPAWWHWV
ncbi:hypothetical protein GOP47_0030627, partial [Adiantum capillus-veneris]